MWEILKDKLEKDHLALGRVQAASAIENSIYCEKPKTHSSVESIPRFKRNFRVKKKDFKWREIFEILRKRKDSFTRRRDGRFLCQASEAVEKSKHKTDEKFEHPTIDAFDPKQQQQATKENCKFLGFLQTLIFCSLLRESKKHRVCVNIPKIYLRDFSSRLNLRNRETKKKLFSVVLSWTTRL